MTQKRTSINIGDEVTLIVNGKTQISIWLHKLDNDQQPELDIMFPDIVSVNCFGHALNPAKANGDTEHIRLAKQLLIPIEE